MKASYMCTWINYYYNSFLALHEFYTHHLRSLKLDHHLCFDTTNHNSKFPGLATWLHEVGSVHVSTRLIFTCMPMCTHFVAFWLLILRTSSLKPQT